MAVTASFSPITGTLSESGDDLDNTIVTSRNAAGVLLVNGGAVPVAGGTPTVANTALIQVSGGLGNDTLTLDEAKAPCRPRACAVAAATTPSPAARAATSCSARAARTCCSARAAAICCSAVPATTSSSAATATTSCSARPATTA